MICYGKGILVCFRTLKSEFPAAKQQWFADDGSTAGKFTDIRAQFERLQQLVPYYRYFPESSKSILVVAPHNVESRNWFTLSRQLHTGEATERDNRFANKVDDWVYSIKKLAGAARDYPQRAYSALQRSVQQEW